MLVKCKECGKEISDHATVCPNCGRPTNVDIFMRNLAEKAYKKEIIKDEIVKEVKNNGYKWEDFVNAYEEYDRQTEEIKKKSVQEMNSALLGFLLFMIVLIGIIVVLVENDGYIPLFTTTGNATITTK